MKTLSFVLLKMATAAGAAALGAALLTRVLVG